MSRVFSNDQADRSSIPCRAIPKTKKMVLDAALLNTQHHKVRINGEVEQSREWSCALPNTSVWKLLKRSLRITLDLGHQLYLPNFKIKTSSSETFLNEHIVGCSIFFFFVKAN